MATFSNILADIDSIPGLIRVKTQQLEDITAGPIGGQAVGDFNINLRKWQITCLRELKRRTSLITFLIYVQDAGLGTEEDWLENPIPETFLKEVEAYLDTQNVLNYKVEDIDEVDQYAIVVAFDIGNNKVSGVRWYVYKDTGAVIHKDYQGIS